MPTKNIKDQPNCSHKNKIGLEYPYGHKARYDGVSEWVCKDCGHRVGRWSGRVLTGDDYERRWGVNLAKEVVGKS